MGRMRAYHPRPLGRLCDRCCRRYFSSSDPSPTFSASVRFPPAAPSSSFPRISIAPMVEVTDVHFRFLLRLLSSSVHLYTPMIPDTAAIAHPSRLQSPPSSPLSLQLAGASLSSLLLAASFLPSPSPYASLNLNVGCPASSAQSGQFGAALMLDASYPSTIRQLHQRLSLPLSIKCRIGVDDVRSYAAFAAFVRRMREEAGVRHFVVHCRPALLSLSPEQNRWIPPLDYSFAERLKDEWGDELRVEVNGGIDSAEAVDRWTRSQVDGVMIGRWATKGVWEMRHIDRWTRQWRTRRRTNGGGEEREEERKGEGEDVGTGDEWEARMRVVSAYSAYVTDVDVRQPGNDARRVLRPLLSLFAGERGCKEWRKRLTEGVALRHAPLDVLHRAVQEVARMRAARVEVERQMQWAGEAVRPCRE